MADDAETLVTWMARLDVSVDVARREIRRRPELQRLGRRIGPTRSYTRSEAERIAAAVKNRRKPAATAAG